MSMLTSFDPFFRDLDHLVGGLGGRGGTSTPWMPVDAYRHGDEFIVSFDLPGVDPESVEVNVDKNMLSVSVERHWAPQDDDQVLMAERPQGRFTRQLFLGDNLETDRIDARYHAGVLTIAIPVAASARPRKVEINVGGREAIAASSSSN